MEAIDDENYILQTPVSIYGQFFPQGTLYRHVNADNWCPVFNGAIWPHYAVSFMIVRNNEAYFKLQK